MAVPVHVSAVATSPTAVVAGPMDLSRIMSCFDAVYAFLATSDVKQVGQNIALYERGRRMEIGVEVDRAFEPVGDVVPSRLPEGRIAHATHTTGYGNLGETYTAIEEWCVAQGLRTTGLCWEIYGDPDERGDVDVEVCYLLE